MMLHCIAKPMPNPYLSSRLPNLCACKNKPKWLDLAYCWRADDVASFPQRRFYLISVKSISHFHFISCFYQYTDKVCHAYFHLLQIKLTMSVHYTHEQKKQFPIKAIYVDKKLMHTKLLWTWRKGKKMSKYRLPHHYLRHHRPPKK